MIIHVLTMISLVPSDVLDQSFLAGLQAGSPSMLPHVDLRDPTTHPQKTLDLGCGSGAWIISAASLWPQTRFVGFDLVPQIANLEVFEETPAPNSAAPPARPFSLTQRRTSKSTQPSSSHNDSTRLHRRLSDRVRFVYGNFLINGLPFEDGEFDHVRIAGIARGVPENKVCHDIRSRRRKGAVADIIPIVGLPPCRSPSSSV